jgi:mRNA-degrading endonuclease YafQ of YafQ-DinJ toxin-antitoxin module
VSVCLSLFERERECVCVCVCVLERLGVYRTRLRSSSGGQKCFSVYLSIYLSISQILVQSNQGGADTTRIHRLVLLGLKVDTTDMKDFKKVRTEAEREGEREREREREHKVQGVFMRTLCMHLTLHCLLVYQRAPFVMALTTGGWVGLWAQAAAAATEGQE